MKGRICSCVAATLLLLPGCGSPRDKATKEFIALEEELVGILDGMTDQASAERGIAQQEEQTKKIQELTKRLSGLGKPSETDRAKLAPDDRAIEEVEQKLRKADKEWRARADRGVSQQTRNRLGVALNARAEAVVKFHSVRTFGP